MTEKKEPAPPPKPGEAVSVTTNPAEATGLQEGVAEVLVDYELEQGTTVRIPQPKRKRRVVFKY